MSVLKYSLVLVLFINAIAAKKSWKFVVHREHEVSLKLLENSSKVRMSPHPMSPLQNHSVLKLITLPTNADNIAKYVSIKQYRNISTAAKDIISTSQSYATITTALVEQIGPDTTTREAVKKPKQSRKKGKRKPTKQPGITEQKNGVTKRPRATAMAATDESSELAVNATQG